MYVRLASTYAAPTTHLAAVELAVIVKPQEAVDYPRRPSLTRMELSLLPQLGQALLLRHLYKVVPVQVLGTAVRLTAAGTAVPTGTNVVSSVRPLLPERRAYPRRLPRVLRPSYPGSQSGLWPWPHWRLVLLCLLYDPTIITFYDIMLFLSSSNS